MIQTILLSDMAKVFPEELPGRYRAVSALDAFAGESLCFQLAYRTDGGQAEFRVQPRGDAPARMWRVRMVGVLAPCCEEGDGDYLSLRPGLFPDLLEPLAPDALVCATSQWQSLFFEYVGLEAGARRLAVRLTDEAGDLLTEEALTARVQPRALPPQRLLYTRWFHCDALAQYYRAPMFGERHWEIVERFVRKAAQRGMNTILTPVHTPPLDTDVGAERLTAQLVDIERDGDGWRFGFDKLDRWIAMCERCGVTHFEMAHLYTQWGAKAAPKIVVDGKRAFGWDTPATSAAYRDFLAAYLPALTGHLRALGVADRCIFHISDEPSPECLPSYLAAKEQAAPYLDGFLVMDALSSVDFYRQGVVNHPIPSVDHFQPFYDAGAPDLWTYYCCGQWRDVTNSFIAMPGERTRILGVLLYVYGVKGFLQWGYNYYFDRHSRNAINPYQTTDGHASWPAGDPFIVYPSPDGDALESLRMLQTQKALEDLRALELLESLTDRAHALRLVAENLPALPTMTDYPRDETYLLRLRERVAQECAALTASPAAR